MDPRTTGALVAIGMATLLVTMQSLIGGRVDFDEPFSLILPAGIPIGAALGWRHGPSTVNSGAIQLGLALLMALQALIVGSTVVAAFMVLGGSSGMVTDPSILGALLTIVGLSGLGILIFGLPITLGLFVLAAAWQWAVLGVWRRQVARCR